MKLVEYLDKAIRSAGLQIAGVSVGDEADKRTWTVQPSSLQAQAQPVIDAYVEPTPNTLLDEFTEKRIAEKALLATAQALWECIPSPTKTKAQMKARAVEIYKTL